jgi:hypothetical protein
VREQEKSRNIELGSIKETKGNIHSDRAEKRP